MMNFKFFPCLILMLLSFQTLLITHKDPFHKEVQVGVILDLESCLGKVVYRFITMATSDFYAANPWHKTRIVFTTSNTKGEPLHALSAALNLSKNTEVQAIIDPESTAEARFLEVMSDEVNIPILLFSTSPSSNQNPYLLRIAQDETAQFKGITAMVVESFKAKNVIVICEDTAIGREMATYMVSAFQEKNIHVTHTSLISTSASKEKLGEELRKLQTIQTMVFVVHTPPSLASNLFSMAKELGMMGEGYVWIITSKITDSLDFMDANAIQSMRGAVDFRSYFPGSRKLHNLVSKWKKEHYALDPLELDSNGIWAYDAVYALAMDVEKVQTTIGMSLTRASLLDQMLRINFQGLGGEFKLKNGRTTNKAMEVVNVIGKSGRKVGFWIMASGEFVKEIGKSNSSSNHGLEDIMWPGGTTTFPKRRILQTNGKKLRILVPDFSTMFSNLIQLSVDPKTNLTTVSGFCGDVFNAAFKALDYGVGAEIIPLPYKEYDAVVGDIMITSNRSLYVDFTLPFSDLGIGIIARNAKKNMWIFLDPLSTDLWITSACFFLFLGFAIWFIEHRTNEEFQGSTRQQIGTTLWFAFSTLVYAHREKVQSNLSTFMVTVWVFVVLVLKLHCNFEFGFNSTTNWNEGDVYWIPGSFVSRRICLQQLELLRHQF